MTVGSRVTCPEDSNVAPDPLGPVGPVGPLGPVAPVVRGGPVAPVAPVAPDRPINPVGPIGPVVPGWSPDPGCLGSSGVASACEATCLPQRSPGEPQAPETVTCHIS